MTGRRTVARRFATDRQNRDGRERRPFSFAAVAAAYPRDGAWKSGIS
ncbi:hypothetical protein [Natronorubrum sp. FCH18a]